jgi:3',5'-cyclic AMP phosphodiesterase CpdA
MKATKLIVPLLVACMAAPALGQSWKFVVVGDTRSDGANNGVNTAIVSELAQAIKNEGARFVLVPGDLANSGGVPGAFTTWRTAMQPVYGVGIGVYPIRGNHDIESSGYWTSAFGADIPDNGPTGEVNYTYSFGYNNAFIVGLDEYVNAHRVNQTWLNQQFAANTKPHVFVFGHEPAFKVNHTDCLDDYATNRNTFWNSIAAEGGRTYFVGHDHLYDHARIDDGDGNPADDIHQYVVGTGGAPFYTSGAYDGVNSPFTPVNILRDIGYYGYAVVEINGYDATISWKHRTAPGVYTLTSDVFSYTAVPEPASLALLALAVVLRSRRGR